MVKARKQQFDTDFDTATNTNTNHMANGNELKRKAMKAR